MDIITLSQKQTFLLNSKVKELKEDVRKQARRHTRRRAKGETVDIIEQVRPNESDEIKDYRADNERQITRAPVEQFVSKVTRIITAGLAFDGIEGRLKEYVDSRPFYDLGNRYDFTDYLYDVIFPLSVEDPNLLWVAFPYIPGRPDIAPAKIVTEGGLGEREALGITMRLVDASYVDDEVFAFVGGQRIIKKNNVDHSVDFYYAADKDYWYVLEPSFVTQPNKQVKLIYMPKIWYKWDLGTSPVNMLPGQSKHTEHGKYRESYLLPYYELADEVIAAFSDYQAVRTRYNYPIASIVETPCHNKSCQSGYIFPEGKGGPKVLCGTCHGTGNVAHPSPWGTIVKPKSTMVGGNTDGPPMDFHHPEVGILQLSANAWRELMKDAKWAIGLDLLEGTGVESGRAKDLRMEDLQDRITQVGLSLIACGVQGLQQIDALLNPVLSDRNDISGRLPASLRIHEATELKENAEQSLFEDRFEARMEFYRHKYRGLPEKIRMYEIALCYCPSLMLTEEEMMNGLASGSATQLDAIKRQYSIIALKSLDVDLLDTSNATAFALIDTYLSGRNLLPVQPAPIFQTA